MQDAIFVGARKAAAMAEAASTAAEDRCGAAQVKAAQAEGERMAAEKMLKALQTSCGSLHTHHVFCTCCLNPTGLYCTYFYKLRTRRKPANAV